MNETKLYYQVKTYTFRRKYAISFVISVLLSIIIILAGLLIYCVPVIAQYARKYGYNETFAIWHTIISNVLSLMLISIICIGLFLVDQKDSPIITAIKYNHPKALIHSLNNLSIYDNKCDKRLFHTSIGQHINLNQEFPEYKNFQYADLITRKKMNQVVKLLINHQIIIRDTNYNQANNLYIWKINV